MLWWLYVKAKNQEAGCDRNSRRLKVKSVQISGTEAIRTKIQPSNPKREITNITNIQNTKRTRVG